MYFFYNFYSAIAYAFLRWRPKLDFIPKSSGIYTTKGIWSGKILNISYEGKSLVYNHGCSCKHPWEEIDGSYDVEYLNLDLSTIWENTNLTWLQQDLRSAHTNVLNIRLGTPSATKALLQKKLHLLEEMIEFLDPLCVVIEIDQNFLNLIVAIANRSDIFFKVPLMIFRVTFDRVDRAKFLHVGGLKQYHELTAKYSRAFPHKIAPLLKGVFTGNGKLISRSKKSVLFMVEVHNGPLSISSAGKIVAKAVQKIKREDYDFSIFHCDKDTISLLKTYYAQEFRNMREEELKENKDRKKEEKEEESQEEEADEEEEVKIGEGEWD